MWQPGCIGPKGVSALDVRGCCEEGGVEESDRVRGWWSEVKFGVEGDRNEGRRRDRYESEEQHKRAAPKR